MGECGFGGLLPCGRTEERGSSRFCCLLFTFEAEDSQGRPFQVFLQFFFLLKKAAERLVALFFVNHFGNDFYLASFLLSFLSPFGALPPRNSSISFSASHGRLIWVAVHSIPSLLTDLNRGTYSLFPEPPNGLDTPAWPQCTHGRLRLCSTPSLSFPSPNLHTG